jgi:hypothetical protein
MITLARYFETHGQAMRAPRVALPFHQEILSALNRLILGALPDGKKNLVVNIPPRHGKTFIAPAKSIPLKSGKNLHRACF